MNKVPVVVAFDDNYVLPGMVMISSLLKNAKDTTFYEIKVLFDGDLSEENRCKISDYIQTDWKDRALVEFVELNGAFDSAPTVSHLSKAAYYRLLMHNFLNYSKVIWCDVDTIIRGDFADLYNVDLEDKYIGACICGSAIVNAEKCFFKGNSFNHAYFSSGVMLVNLDRFREEKIENKFFKVIEKHGDKLLFLDQDILNEVIKGDYKELPWRYNSYCDIYKNKFGDSYYKKIRQIYDDKYLEQEFDNIVVSHYEGSDKPWTKKGFRKEWFQIALKTPFKEEALKKYKEAKSLFNLKSALKQLKIKIRQFKRKI